MKKIFLLIICFSIFYSSVKSQTVTQYLYEFQHFLDKKEYCKAIEPLEKAAKLNSAEAQYWLFQLYNGGNESCKNDEILAQQWLDKAVAAKYPKALYWKGKRLATKSYIASGNKKKIPGAVALEVIDYYKEAANLGYGYAAITLAELYANPADYEEIEKDLKASIRWYRAAEAIEPNPTIEFQLAVLYSTDDAEIRDDSQAAEWLQKAAKDGEMYKAHYYVSLMYAQGRGVEQSDAESEKWFSKAVYGLDEEALAILLTVYEMSKNKEEIPAEYAWMPAYTEKLKTCNHYRLRMQIGEMYAGADKQEEAFEWYKSLSDEIEKVLENDKKEAFDRKNRVELYYRIANIYHDKAFSQHNLRTALGYFESAAMNKHEAAKDALIKEYQQQLRLATDPKAIQVFKERLAFYGAKEE